MLVSKITGSIVPPSGLGEVGEVTFRLIGSIIAGEEVAVSWSGVTYQLDNGALPQDCQLIQGGTFVVLVHIRSHNRSLKVPIGRITVGTEATYTISDLLQND